VQFAFDSYELEPGFLTLLEAHAAAMKAQPALRVVVEGHADERGGSEYNLALGQKRAEAVVKALALLGVAPERLEAVSFGDTRPVDLARTPEAWAKNRRAELRLP
jgi:peptidoglycan-associated lipoprotein